MKPMANICKSLFHAVLRDYRVVVLLTTVLSGCGNGFGQATVFDAVKTGDLDTVKADVQAYPNVLVQTDYFGRTLLQDAVIYGQTKVLLFLLDNGADVNRQAPLITAAGSRQLEAARILLDHKADANAKDEYGSTPLITACSVGAAGDVVPYGMVRLLLAHAADVNAKNSQGTTALDSAAASDRKQIVTLLLTQKADVNAMDDNGWTPLHYAAVNGAVDVIETLTAHGADIDAKDKSGRTPLDLAADPEAGAFPRDPSPAAGRMNVLKLLLSHKAQYSAFDAAATGDLDALKAFVNGNPDLVFTKSWHGNTLLHYAALLENKDMAEFLIANKAKIDAINEWGRTPLHDAAEFGRTDVVELLLANKADANARDKGGQTPLHLASMMGRNHADVVRLLLEHGADVNAKDNAGNTPLEEAMRNGPVAEVLRTYGGHF